MMGLDIVVALLAAIGVFAVFWMLFGHLLTPARRAKRENLFAVVRASGAGETLEADVNALLWLEGSRLAPLQLVILDNGLTQDGLELALHLCSQWSQVALISPAELSSYIAENP